MAYNANDIAKLGHLASLASKVKGELTALDNKYAGSFRSVSVSGNTVSFFTTTDGTGTAVASFDFPEELFLQQTGTEIVTDFAWSAATYPGSTNPNLDGKTVLVLAVKGNKATNATVKYSFVDMANVIKAITAGDNSITVNGYAINVRISAVTGNLLELKSDGLFVGSDDTKVDKVTGKQLSTEDYTTAEKTKLAGIAEGAQVNVIETVKVDGTALAITNKAVDIDLTGKVDKVTSATSGNFVLFGANGAIADSTFKVASDADVAEMLETYFPSVAGGGN